MNRADFAYGQARLHAEHQNMLTTAEWKHFKTIDHLALFLDQLNSTALQYWVIHLSVHTPVMEIEKTIAKQWYIYVHKISQWQPTKWRLALQWSAHCAYLDNLYAFKRNPNFDSIVPLELHSIEEMGWIFKPKEEPFDEWFTRWLSKWPRRTPSKWKSGLLHWASMFKRYREMIFLQDKESLNRNRKILFHDFNVSFRKHRDQPVSAYCFLFLKLLEVFRLQAEILRRRLRP